MSARERLSLGCLLALLFLGAAFIIGRSCAPSSTAVADGEPSAKVEHAVAQENVAAVKTAVTKRRAADRRVAQEVQREVTRSDLADYLGSHATGGGSALGGDPDRGARDQGDGAALLGGDSNDGGDPVAPGAP